LAVAQHRSNKNLPLLLSAYAALRQQGAVPTDLRLIIVGAEGPETPTVRALVEKLALNEHVVFLSALPDAELCWLYQHCALVILPSKIEGFCLPLGEALRCGSNILCSDIPVLREIGGDACRYFDLHAPNPMAELASSIANAMRDPKVPSASAARFSPESITSQYVALYQRLLTGESESALDEMSDDDAIRPRRYAV
jgi:glycosyltransferase involved in cell wall biosynthesis